MTVLDARTDPTSKGPSAPLDRTLALLLQGYVFAGRLRGAYEAVGTRLMGRPAVVLGGREGARLFYDTDRFQRTRAVPRPVRRALVGEGAVHTLDDQAHLDRKAMHLAAVQPDSVARLVDIATRNWDATARDWPSRDRVVLFDEAARVLTASALEWAGAPPDPAALPQRAADLVAVVDGPVPGRRHLTARLARRRAERWAGALVGEVRVGRLVPPAGSPLAVVAGHRGSDGRPLDDRLAAVELLNLVRPTVAVSWFIAFAALALHHEPPWRLRLATADDRLLEAFVDEVRRFYPFTPVLGARARHAFAWGGQLFPPGRLAVLDVYGTDHDPALWTQPERFDPDRFLPREPEPFTFIPQGGGDPATGHRCPGERVTVEMVKTALRLLVRLRYDLPAQDLGFSLSRIPTRPRSGVVLTSVGPA